MSYQRTLKVIKWFVQQHGNDFRPPGQEILDPYSIRYVFFTNFIGFIQLQLQFWRSSFFHSISQYETNHY